MESVTDRVLIVARRQGRPTGNLQPMKSPPGVATGRAETNSKSLLVADYWQVGNLKVEIRVLQLNAPVFNRYSVVYQKVQSSLGSRVALL